jgi:hypothetical protein
MACPIASDTQHRDVPDELSYAGNFLERATDPDELSGAVDRDLTWMYIAFLFAVTLTLFSTKLLAAFIAYRTALLVYWLNILLLERCCTPAGDMPAVPA